MLKSKKEVLVENVNPIVHKLVNLLKAHNISMVMRLEWAEEEEFNYTYVTVKNTKASPHQRVLASIVDTKDMTKFIKTLKGEKIDE